MTEDRCYREPTNGVYFTRNTHRTDCVDPECRGCKPCPASGHCVARRNCSWHIAEGDLTCGRCIAGVRRDLRWIRDLSSLLLPAAITDGIESQAANLAGPAVDPGGWSQRRIAMRGHLAGWFAHGKITEGAYLHARAAMEDDDEQHPLRVLGTWDRMIREDYDHPTSDRLTVTSAAGYLDRQLHRIAQDDEQDFELLRRELRKCRQHIEAVLHNDDRRDQGAPCPACAAARREEIEAAEREGRGVTKKPLPLLERHYAHWCTDEECERMHFEDDGSDVWRCPRMRDHWWTQQGYADLLEQRRTTA